MHWCRWPIAAAVAAGCYVALAPDPSPLGRARWSCGKVRQWLAADDSPLQHWRRVGIPALQIDLRTSPPLDQASARALADVCTEGIATRDTTGHEGSRALLVPVRVGDFGVHAEIAVPDGSGVVFEAMFPSNRWAVGVSIAGAIAVLAWPRRRAAG
jgi:hypothetical protein